MADETVFLWDRTLPRGAAHQPPPARGRARGLREPRPHDPLTDTLTAGAAFASVFSLGGLWTSTAAFASTFTVEQKVATATSGANFRSEFVLGGAPLATGRYRR
jgi:hypothetical protein